jgi:hypothetical protein
VIGARLPHMLKEMGPCQWESVVSRLLDVTLMKLRNAREVTNVMLMRLTGGKGMLKIIDAQYGKRPINNFNIFSNRLIF